MKGFEFKMKILLADDVEELAEAVGVILENNNYEVEIVFNGKDALERVKKNKYDCIILDVMMPIMNGFEVVRNIRNLNISTPIILLTAKSLVDDKVKGLDIGANDYITKPFEKEELLARIRLVTRKEEYNNKFVIGNIVFNKEKSQILKDNVALNLNKQECDILELFLKNPETKISEAELQEIIWENKKVNDGIVPMYISYLNEKFNALNANIRVNDVGGYKLEIK